MSAAGADRPTPPRAVPPARGGLAALRLARLRRSGRLVVEADVRLGRGVRLELGGGARIILGKGCAIGDRSRLLARGGDITIGQGAVLGERCTLVAHGGMTVGAGAVLGDGAMAVDFDHGTQDVERPIRLQPLEIGRVTIDERARIGPGAGVLRGVTVGAGAVVGAHAVVTRDVRAGARVGGVPAHRDSP